ncbi:MAG: MBOAT family protein [Planctomycetes bacterium]|nr:MBOAT family protein [Planctomycetota bacterium]
MVFSSTVFLFYFLTAVLAIYYLLPQKARQAFLTLASFVFYGWANPWFVPLMIASTLLDYFCGRMMTGHRQGRRRLALCLSVIGNLSILGFFKYAGFAQENLNWILQQFGRPTVEIYRVALPLGISFYTFQTMSYSIDLYRGRARPARNLLDFSCFVSMFPQLVAGPIVRYSHIAEQLSGRTHTLDKFARGIAFFIFGLAKKVLLANPMGEVADAAFDAGHLAWIDAWTGVIAYAFQIYFDFSGYSDMAIGLGLMLGFTFAKNFDSPYLADSITNFWQRWHISLSSFLRDYLYIPLGGNRKGPARTYLNLMIVMLLGGLWHGAAWNFVIWGAIHGAMLAGERIIGKTSIYGRLPRVLRVALTFAVVCVAWVFFRASDLDSAGRYIAAMFGVGEAAPATHLLRAVFFDPYHLTILAVCALVAWGCKQSWDHAQRIGLVKTCVLLALFTGTVAVMCTQTYNPFIYFIF